CDPIVEIESPAQREPMCFHLFAKAIGMVWRVALGRSALSLGSPTPFRDLRLNLRQRCRNALPRAIGWVRVTPVNAAVDDHHPPCPVGSIAAARSIGSSPSVRTIMIGP